MIDRRGFLQAFGIGAIAVPVIAGVPKFEHTARIIEPPKVELVTPEIPSFSSLPPFDAHEVRMTVTMIDKRDGKRYDFTADSFITGYKYKPVTVTHLIGTDEFIPTLSQLRYTINGVITRGPANPVFLRERP